MTDSREMTEAEFNDILRDDIQIGYDELHRTLLNGLPDGPFKNRAMSLLNLTRDAAMVAVEGGKHVEKIHQYAMEGKSITDPALKDQYLARIAEMTASQA